VFEGKVTEVANIGEQLRNSNAKVFEVKILLLASDSVLRPAMTTQNIILTGSVPDVISIPVEAVHTQDSLTFVYMATGRQVKREVTSGISNETSIIITAGLEEGEEVLLNIPEDPEKYKWQGLETKDTE
jgi:multidrug efflux pump subunit AcrA (membrane-fusion protein)